MELDAVQFNGVISRDIEDAGRGVDVRCGHFHTKAGDRLRSRQVSQDGLGPTEVARHSLNNMQDLHGPIYSEKGVSSESTQA